MAFQLTPEQQAVVDNRGGELLVSAAAGSGKTRVLVERLLSRVEEEGRNLDEFLVITFTRAAAAELRGKIAAELNRRLALHPENRHLRRQTALVYRAQISTIHAFCTAFLRENSHLLELDPDFRVADDTEAELLRAETLDRLLEERYAHLEEGGFGTLVDTLSAGRDDTRLKDIVLYIHTHIQAHEDPERWLQEQAAAFALEGESDAGRTPWGRLLMEDARRQVEYWRGQMIWALDLLRESGDEALMNAWSDSFSDTLDDMDDFLGALDRRWDSARAMSEVRFPRLRAARGVQDAQTKELVAEIRKSCKAAMEKLAGRFETASADLIGDLIAVGEPVRQLFALVSDLEDAFQQAKKRKKLVDFNDLEHFTVRALVRDGAPTELARRGSERYAEVMVDEYQDTNAVQNTIFSALTGGGRTLFQVGDIKQSIYRFRLADPTIFREKYNRYDWGRDAAEGQPRKLVLSMNFRSRREVLDGVNFLFENLMTEAFGEITYDENHRLHQGLSGFPSRAENRVELDVLDLAGVETAEKEAAVPKDQQEARFVARRVRELLEEPFLVTEGEALRPVKPEEIAILYRSPGKVLRYLTAALDAEGVPWQQEGSEDFFSTTEVNVVLSFLQIADNARQDVPLLSVLRSPVYGFTPDQLSQLRSACPQGNYFYDCVAYGALEGEEHCKRFLRDLEALRLRMIDSSCAQLIWYLYDEMGLMGLFSAMPGGERRQENLLTFYEFARSFEGQGHRGVFALVSQLRRMMARGKKPAASRLAAGSGVKIMSIHKSKGLEFPVVVLAGLSRRFNAADETAPMLFHPELGVGPKLLDRERNLQYPTLARTAVSLRLNREMKAEELRLLYVAMTRVKEKLILVNCLKDGARTVRRLLPGAGPHPEPEALAQMNCMGDWVLLPVLARRDAGALRGEARPPVYAETEDHWDIRLVTPEQHRTPRVLLPQEEQESAAIQVFPAAAEGLRWRYPHPELAELPSKLTATQLKGRLLDEEAAENTRQPRTPTFRRPSFEQRERGLTPAEVGTAIHTLMEHIRPERGDTQEGVAAEIQELVKKGYLTGEQGAAIPIRQVARFWASPLGQEAAASAQLRREFKFSILAPASRYYQNVPEGEEVLLQGVVDCCFEDITGFTVIDFKSDRLRRGAERQRAEEYRAQLEAYSAALEEIFARPVKRRVLWFLCTGTAVEV